jgi:hypothetical protein
MNRTLVSMLLISILCALPAAAGAVQVLPVNLEGLVEKAGLIFEGTCLSVDYRTDEQGLLSTYTTFTVHQLWKGPLSQTLTIKTYGGIKGSLKAVIPGMPTFRPGETVLLFLHPASEIGFTSPVGMGQGRFKIFTAPDGRKKAVNDDNNRHLFRNMDQRLLEAAGHQDEVRQFRITSDSSAGPVDHDVLKSLIETILQRLSP